MKTLYININNEKIQSNEDLEVLKHDLDSDFFFYLGEKIAKDCNVENENALIADFNTKDNKEDYRQIIAQWNELKNILFSEECEGKFELTLPSGYIHWLRYSEKYNSIYDKNFSHGEPAIVTIDLEGLYEDSVEDLQRKILHKLQRDDLYREIDEIVFNDDAVTHESSIVKMLKNKYGGIRFCHYKKYNEKTAIILIEQPKLNRPQLRNDAKIAPQKNKSLENVHPKSPKQLSSKSSYGSSQGYSWQTQEYLAIIKQDRKKQTLEKVFENDTDNAGNQMSEYLEVFNHTTHYRKSTDCVIIGKNKQNNIPQFYNKIGCYWGMKGTEFLGVFEKLGFTCVKGYGHIRAIKKCKKYNYCVEITAAYNNSDYIDMTYFIFSRRK